MSRSEHANLWHVVAEALKHAEILVKADSRVACTLNDSEGTGRVECRSNNETSYEINGTHVNGIVDIGMSRQLDAA